MKILYLKLKNFANIYTAMSRKEIEIDLSKSKNTIIVFDGPNGSGKTSILSMMHPFAYVGSLDIRSNSNLILDGEDGYKEIHISNNNDLYKIQHYYKNSATRGITLKSFIQKNDVELNPNGNVTSFIECIRVELSLELDFLRLIRLGSNVSNLIDMKTTERKNYTAYLLSDINVYTSLYKKINEDNRLIKNLMKSVNDKLEKLQIIDIDLTHKEITQLEERLNELNNRKSELLNTQGNISGRISTIAPDGVNELFNKRKTLMDTIEDLKALLDRNLKLVNKSCVVLTGSIEETIESIMKDIRDVESRISSKREIVLFYKEQLSELYNEKDKITSKISSLTSDVEYHQITNFHLELKLRIKEMEKKFKSYENLCTKDEYILILNTINQINSIMSEIYGFNNKSIKKTVELLRRKENIDSYVNESMKVVNKKILKITSQFKSGSINEPLVIFKPHNCEVPECPYLYLYDLLFSNSDDKTSLSSLESEKEMLNDILNINKNISYIFMIIKSVMSLIVKGQLRFLTIDNILDTIYSNSLLNYEDHITNLIAEVEEYDSYISAKDECKKIESEIKLINANKDNIDELTSQLKEKDIKLAELIKVINDNEFEISKLEKGKETLIDILEIHETYKSRNEEIDKYTNQLGQTVKELTDIETIIKDIESLSRDLNNITSMINNVTWDINKINKDLIDKKFSVKEFENLTEEQNKLNDEFDELSIIKESLSSTKGIPLLFIKLYLKSTKLYVNDLLRKIYNEFEIDDFDIDENEFNIPYIKNGIRINDVAYASQGEKSFLSLAISFSLIIQSIKNYNILLLDEVDATLDTKNRAMFLTILENWIDKIEAEQVFLITHNNMFDNYPVDVICTSKHRVESYNNANVIFSL